MAAVASQLLRARAPAFAIQAECINILTAPSEFYGAILHSARNARHRVALSSLYLGTGRLEAAIVDALGAARERGADIHVLLDVNRGTRGCPSSTDILRPLVERGARVNLYNTPQLRGGLKRLLRPPFNEVVGLQHAKLYVFDDVTIVSGANLSSDYFAQRQDRCIVFRDQRLADFCADVIAATSATSLRLKRDGSMTPENIDPRQAPQKEVWQALGENLTSTVRKAQNEPISGNPDTVVYPLVQMGRAGVNMDEDVSPELIASAPGHIHLASGYFNLSPRYLAGVFDSKATVDVLAAAPTANGFLGARGIRGHIPAAYTQIEKDFLLKVAKVDHARRVKLSEYSRPDWTFHAKGIWLADSVHDAPYLTVVGSSNLGRRSAQRDVEAQFAVATTNPDLRSQMATEVQRLFSFSAPVTLDMLNNNPSRQVKLWEKVVTRLIASFL